MRFTRAALSRHGAKSTFLSAARTDPFECKGFSPVGGGGSTGQVGWPGKGYCGEGGDEASKDGESHAEVRAHASDGAAGTGEGMLAHASLCIAAEEVKGGLNAGFWGRAINEPRAGGRRLPHQDQAGASRPRATL